MHISLEFVFHRLGLNNPLISTLPVLMNKLSGLVGVHRMNLILSVLYVRGLDLKALNEHLLFWFVFAGKMKISLSLSLSLGMLLLPLNLNLLFHLSSRATYL